LLRGRNPTAAIRMFRYSIIYLMLLFGVLLVDHYLMVSGIGTGTGFIFS
jgi:protoheme IX farnesyltransferase